MVRLWQNLNQQLKSLENPTNWPVQPLDSHSAATGWTGSDRLLEKDWSGLQLSVVVVATHTTLSQFKAGSPSPETTAESSCICRWTVWRLKILLFIIVLETHSDWVGWAAVQNPTILIRPPLTHMNNVVSSVSSSKWCHSFTPKHLLGTNNMLIGFLNK